MDKYRLRLDEYTISARDNCVLTTPQEAELAFLQQGICGKVMLVQVFKFVTELIPCDNGYGALSVMKYLWLCFCGDGEVVSLPLFYEDNEWNEVEKNLIWCETSEIGDDILVLIMVFPH